MEEKITKFDSGAVRGQEKFEKFPARFDLISHIGERRLAETYGEGALKYGDNNWLNGIPLSNLLNHAKDHINRYLSGDRTEDHLAHAAWNLFAAMHMEVTNPNMNDLLHKLPTLQELEAILEKDEEDRRLYGTTGKVHITVPANSKICHFCQGRITGTVAIGERIAGENRYYHASDACIK